MKKESTTSKVFGEEAASVNEKPIDAYFSYSKAASIIERVNVALGRKKIYTITSATTTSIKPNKNVFTTTVQKFT